MTTRKRCALVTGGAVRVGRAIVDELARAGWRVMFTYKTSADAARQTERALHLEGLDAAAVQANLDEEADWARLRDRVGTSFGGLDGLVNNAAVFPRTPIEELTPKAFRAVMQTNLEAPLFLALTCAPLLRERGGAIVNVVDIYGAFPLRHHLAYSTSKAALAFATRALALELAPEVRVNAVAPGIAVFPSEYDEPTRQRMIARTLLRREGSAAEVARAVRYLLDDTHTMTGQVLTLDGGRTVAL